MASRVGVASLRAEATRLTLPNGLVVDRLKLETGQAEWGESGLSLGEPAGAQARIGAASLESFIASKVPPMVQDVRVSLESGNIIVSAHVHAVIRIPATLRLGVRIANGNALHVELLDIEPGIARGPIETELAKANPVLEASDLPFPLRFDAVDVTSEAIELSASA